MKWLEISVQIEREDTDAVSDLFDGMGTGGVVIEDPALIYNAVAEGSIETVVLDPPADPFSPPVVKGYLPVDCRLPGKLEEFISRLAGIDPEYPARVSYREIEESSWLDRWKEYCRPVRVGRRLLVKPSRISPEPWEGLLVVEMDPGLAFGCGTHPTTAMCMALLEESVGGGETVIDVGTGSGILAITAARLGAAWVLALDSDPVAVRVARENVAANGVEGIVAVREGNLLEGVCTPADVIVANIMTDVIIRLLPSAAELLKAGGRFIASGVIAGRREEVAVALEASGLRTVRILNEGEWVSFLAEKIY